MSKNAITHWDNVYRTKAPDGVSWYRPHLERSIDLIQRVDAICGQTLNTVRSLFHSQQRTRLT